MPSPGSKEVTATISDDANGADDSANVDGTGNLSTVDCSAVGETPCVAGTDVARFVATSAVVCPAAVD